MALIPETLVWMIFYWTSLEFLRWIFIDQIVSTVSRLIKIYVTTEDATVYPSGSSPWSFLGKQPQENTFHTPKKKQI